MAFSNLGNSGSSLTQDSDEIEEMYCEQCHRHDNEYKEAAGFCVDCKEYLCDTCLKYHRRQALNHFMQNKDNMPQDFCFEKCSIHPNQIIKFYCGDCQNFPCSICKSSCHQNCTNISHLPTLIQGIENCTELKDLITNLDKLSQKIEQTEEKVNHNLQRVVAQETKTLAATRKLKENLMVIYTNHQQKTIDTFDQKMKRTLARLKEERTRLVEKEAKKQKEFERKLSKNEKNVTDKVANIRDSDQKQLKSIQGTSLTMKNDLKTLSSAIVQQQNTNQRCKLFVTMKKGIQETEKLKNCLHKLQGSNDIHNYCVESEVRELNVSSLQNAKTCFSFRELLSSNSHVITVNFLHNLEVKAAEESSLCLLNENAILIADFKDQILIVKNVNFFKKPYIIKRLASGPWAIAKVEDSKVAVTFPVEGIVRLLTFPEPITDIDSIKVGKSCRGIAYSNNNLIVSYDTNPGKVQILDMSGNVLKYFDKENNGKPLFCEPWYLTLSPENTTLYVSDRSRETVTSMTLGGKVTAIYSDEHLRGPCQMTVDESGAVYVCGCTSHNVHKLSSDLTKLKILLDRENGMNHPMNVTYSQKNNKLYVKMCGSSTIEVFKVMCK